MATFNGAAIYLPATKSGDSHMPEEKAAERRPEAKEGGREEEENRLRISTEPIALGRPLSKKTAESIEHTALCNGS
jgi:hypothetical protein